MLKKQKLSAGITKTSLTSTLSNVLGTTEPPAARPGLPGATVGEGDLLMRGGGGGVDAPKSFLSTDLISEPSGQISTWKVKNRQLSFYPSILFSRATLLTFWLAILI